MSAFPSMRTSNAISLPSGDQRAEPGNGPPNQVSCTGLRPSRSHTQSSQLPERLEEKAIRLPSGEYCGESSWKVEAISRLGRPAPFPGAETGSSMRQMLVSRRSCVKARRLPTGEIEGETAFGPTSTIRSGLPPVARSLHRLGMLPPHSEEKTSSLPSGVQVTP